MFPDLAVAPDCFIWNFTASHRERWISVCSKDEKCYCSYLSPLAWPFQPRPPLHAVYVTSVPRNPRWTGWVLIRSWRPWWQSKVCMKVQVAPYFVCFVALHVNLALSWLSFSVRLLCFFKYLRFWWLDKRESVFLCDFMLCVREKFEGSVSEFWSICSSNRRLVVFFYILSTDYKNSCFV